MSFYHHSFWLAHQHVALCSCFQTSAKLSLPSCFLPRGGHPQHLSSQGMCSPPSPLFYSDQYEAAHADHCHWTQWNWLPIKQEVWSSKSGLLYMLCKLQPGLRWKMGIIGKPQGWPCQSQHTYMHAMVSNLIWCWVSSVTGIDDEVKVVAFADWIIKPLLQPRRKTSVWKFSTDIVSIQAILSSRQQNLKDWNGNYYLAELESCEKKFRRRNHDYCHLEQSRGNKWQQKMLVLAKQLEQPFHQHLQFPWMQCWEEQLSCANCTEHCYLMNSAGVHIKILFCTHHCVLLPTDLWTPQE